MKILVLEDEPLIGMLLGDWLAELGCEAVGPIASLDDAIQAIQHTEFDAAILDVTLVGGESFPAADALIARHKPFAFATGRDGVSVKDRFPAAGVLQKPYDFSALKTVVQGWSAPATP